MFGGNYKWFCLAFGITRKTSRIEDVEGCGMGRMYSAEQIIGFVERTELTQSDDDFDAHSA